MEIIPRNVNAAHLHISVHRISKNCLAISPAFARLADIDEPEIFAFVTAFVIFPLSKKKFLHRVKDFTVEKIFLRFFGGNKK